MKAMEQKETLQLAPPLPVLPRLDRLDRLLQLLEEKHSMSRRHLYDPVVKKSEQKQEEKEDQCKTLSSALEEVHHKGTLMDRLAVLENRLLQLSLEMDEGNTSRSSSSTLAVSKGSRHDEGEEVTQQAKKDELLIIQERPSKEESTTKSTEKQSGKREKRKGYIKWIGWFRCGKDRQWNDDFGPNSIGLRSK